MRSHLCVRRPEALLTNKYLFLGKVIAASWDADRGSFVLKPVRVWKGGWPGDGNHFRVTTRGSAMCGCPLALGAYYIFGASTEPQEIGECSDEPIPLFDA